ncbi:MAG: hypothetical protein EXR76_04645 [Myxococcales bacterium]|nr:hypothetical protein [Myxococcales bacterium]
MKTQLSLSTTLPALLSLGLAFGCDDSGPGAATTTPDASTGGSGGDGGGPVLTGLTVSDPNARGCEVLFTEGRATIEAVTFDATVVGTFIREAPRVALSFVSAADAAIAVGSIRVDAKAVALPEASVTV